MVPVRLILFISLSFAGVSRAAICRFQGLGDLQEGDFYSKAYGVSADGRVVVGSSNSAFGTEAFRWTESEGMFGLGDLEGGGFLSRAYAVSANGDVIVGASFSEPGISVQAFRWENDVMTGLGGLPEAPYIYSVAYAVSADGSVIVGESESASGTEAFRLTQEEGMVGLGNLGGYPESTAYGVSADGSVIVGVSNPPGLPDEEAFRWTQEEGMVGLGYLVPVSEDAFSFATAVSADGSVIVGYSAPTNWNTIPGSEPFRWENGVMTGLGARGCAWAVSANGSVIVGDDDDPILAKAFIWDEKHGMRYLKDVLENECGLDLTGWTLERATGVSADGLIIVGYGINHDGFTEGWIATIPEPATFLLLAFGGLALLRIQNGKP